MNVVLDIMMINPENCPVDLLIVKHVSFAIARDHDHKDQVASQQSSTVTRLKCHLQNLFVPQHRCLHGDHMSKRFILHIDAYP